MATNMDLTPPCGITEDSYSKDNESDMDNENLDYVKRISLGKPPCHLSVMCNSIGSTKLITEVNLSSSDEKNEFLPILRSGSCAEMGTKQYMEDEHDWTFGDNYRGSFSWSFLWDASSLDMSSGTTVLIALIFKSYGTLRHHFWIQCMRDHINISGRAEFF